MIFQLWKADTVTLGIDSFIVKANKKSGKKESQKKTKENETTLTELLKLEKLNNTETDKNQKKNQMKSKKINRIHYPIQQFKTDKKSTKIYEKISMIDRKNEKKSLFDLFKDYVDGNWKKALDMISVYIIFLGSIIGTPILVHHFRANDQYQVDQFKEGFIVNHTLQFIFSFSL